MSAGKNLHRLQRDSFVQAHQAPGRVAVAGFLASTGHSPIPS